MNVISTYRSSPPEMFLGKGVLKICSKFTGEHQSQSVISIKLHCNFIQITFQHGYSPVNLLHIFRTPFYKNISRGLPLDLLFLAINIKIRTNSFNYIKNIRIMRCFWCVFSRMQSHCVKCVHMRSFFWCVFSRIWTEYGEVSLRIQSKYGKIRTRKNSVFGHFSRSE